MNKTISAIAAFSLAVAIVLGAWNAHGMQELVTAGKMSENYIKTFYTGVQYQFICSLGLLVLGLSAPERKLTRVASWLIFAGMLMFSVSIYFLSFHEMLGEGFKKLGIVTPFGGIFMATGWLLVGISLLKKTS